MRKSTIILFFIVLILLFWIYFFERKAKSTSEIEERKDNVFVELMDEPEEISRVGFQDFKIFKDGDNYFLKEPISDPCDISSVKGFVESFKSAKSERILKNPPPLNELGLTEPKIKIIFKYKEKEIVLKIGNNPPEGKGAYFFADGRVGVLSDLTLQTVKREINNFRAKELCYPISLDEIKSLKIIKNGKDEFLVEKKGDKWLCEHPFKDFVDTRKISFLIEDIVLWPIMEIPEEIDEDESGITESKEIIELTKYDNKKVTIKLGRLKDEEKKFYYATTSNRNGVFVVSKNSVRNIDSNWDEFRSLEIFPSSFDGYDEIEVKKEGSIKFIKKGKDFISENKKVDENMTKTFFYAITSLEGEKILNHFDGEKIFSTITLKSGGQKRKITFFEDGEAILAFVEERNIFIKLSKEGSERVKGAIIALFTKIK